MKGQQIIHPGSNTLSLYCLPQMNAEYMKKTQVMDHFHYAHIVIRLGLPLVLHRGVWHAGELGGLQKVGQKSIGLSQTLPPILCCYDCLKTSHTQYSVILTTSNQQQGYTGLPRDWEFSPSLQQSTQQPLEGSCRPTQNGKSTTLFQETERSRLIKKHPRTLIFQVYKMFQTDVVLCCCQSLAWK